MRRSTGESADRRAIAERAGRWSRALGSIAAVGALVLSALVLGPVPAASAGTLNLTITPIDISDNSTITSIADGQHDNRITYRVQFACQGSPCTAAQVQFSPSQSDPLGLLPTGRYLLSYESWVAPVSGGTISGTDQTGMTVDLGNLASGDSGDFRLTYAIPGDQYRAVPYGSFYPDGFQIQMGATLSSSNSTSVTANASAVTWNVALPSTPTASISVPASSEPDTVVTYRLPMNPGNMYIGGGNAGVRGDATYQAIGNYTVVYHLPPEADLVGTPTQGGVYDPIARTITWQQGTLSDPIYGARGGWGVNAVSGFNGGGAAADNPPGSTLADDYAYFYYREVQLTFPATRFPAADANGCNFSANVSSQLDVTVNYLDSARTQRTISVPRTAQIACWDPFVGVDVQKYVNNYSAWVNPIYMLNVPATGNPPITSPRWYVQVSNSGNIPAQAVIDEPNLSQPDLPVWQIWPSGVGATVEWTRSDGATGTTTLASGGALTAPGTTYYTSARVTTNPIPAGRVQPTDTTWTTVYVYFGVRISDTAPLGAQRTNTANVSVSYPGHTGSLPGTNGNPVTLPVVQNVSRTIQFSRPSPRLTAAFSGAPVVGGPQLTPGTPVTYTATGTTDTIWPGTTIVPQYVFVAPIGWNVIGGTASVPGAPAGTTYDYRTVIIGGVSRSVVVATWPSSITPSTTAAETWPALTVQATPTASAPTGPNAATALVWVGDASGNLSDAVGSQAYATASNQFRALATSVVDTGDADNDGNTAEEFAQATSAALTVAGSSGLQVIKELCIVPDTAAPDGCATWTSDTTTPHPVPVNATDIAYRITIANPGATALTDVVAYDVLPHVGDTSLTVDATPRGSQFPLVIQSATPGPGVTMDYSASTDPRRVEVNPGTSGNVDDWGPGAAGKVAARITVGTLAGGQSRQVVIVAAVQGVQPADSRACNSVAIDSGSTLPTEPTPVCLRLAEADLEVELTTFEKLQAGRPTTLGYTVTNHGGSAEAPATVQIVIPAGLTVTDLAPSGWDCVVVGGGTAPLSGPATLNCAPEDGAGQPRLLQNGVPDELLLPAIVDDDSGQLCTAAAVTGDLYDPDMSNNTDSGCQQIAPPPAGLTLTKDDGQTSTQIGAVYTYTITVTNTLLAETVEDAVVTDTLPASLEYVSSDPVAAVTGQTLTWDLDPLTPLAEVELQVTVRVLANPASPIVNEASVTAPDPGFPNETLTDSDEDSDAVLALAVVKTSDARASGVRDGDTITYTVTVTGDAAGDYVGATITDDLSDVLDEATFVTGSAELSIDGGTPQAVADPVSDVLSWTGTIPAGAVVVLTYRVTVGDAVSGELVNTVRTSPDRTDCDPATGLDEDGFACAVLSTPFAPTIAKAVDSLSQADDGSWTIVYGIDVVNPAPTGTVYDLGDDLAFGPGITVTSATVTAPPGITPETWTGSGDVALNGALPAGATHHYTVTVVADAGTVPGTAAAVCTPGAALGFANTATLTLSDATELDTEACADPVEPTVEKALVGTPTKDPVTGRWTVTYRVTVTNGAAAPADLAYTLADALDFPAGPIVHAITVTPSGGGAANPSFTGGLAAIDGTPVTADPALTDGVVRIAAASGGTPTVHEYLVEVEVSAPAGSVPANLVACGAPGAGYGNWVQLFAGSSQTESGRDTACADIRLPELQFTKIADHPSGTRPGDRITYTIIATNVGDADFTAGDPAELVDDMSGLLDDGSYLGDAVAGSGTVLSVPPALTWTGPLPAGAIVQIRYTVRLGTARSGDGSIVNQIRLAGVAGPGGAVPACAATPAGNAGLSACAVTLQLDTRSLAFTGTIIPLSASLAAAFAAIAAGILLTRRRRRTG